MGVNFRNLLPVFLGCLQDSPPPMMMHSPQMPQFNTIRQQSPPQSKKHVSCSELCIFNFFNCSSINVLLKKIS